MRCKFCIQPSCHPEMDELLPIETGMCALSLDHVIDAAQLLGGAVKHVL